LTYVTYESLEQASDQQKQWFYRYLSNGFNASEAARYAKYKDAQQSGWENKKYFSKLIAAEFKNAQMTKDEALARISDVARASLIDVSSVHYDEAGNIIGLNLDVTAAATNGKAHLIKEVSYNQFGIKLKLHDALKANHLIAAGFGASEENDSELDGILEALKGVANEAVDVHTQDQTDSS
jgi:hypothetical protein